MRRHFACLALALVLSATPAHGQATSSSGQDEQPDSPGGVRFVIKKPPSLRFGETARVDFRFKLHSDFRSFAPDLRREDPFDLRRARAGVEGRFLNAFEYELEYDFREDDYPIRDAFVDVRVLRPLQVRAGKFKVPFSREELTGVTNLDFAHRARAADQLSPGRSVGAMVHGRLLQRRLQYQVGVFREDGEHGRRSPPRLDAATSADSSPDPVRTTSPVFAARTTMSVGGRGALKDLEVGAAMTTGHVEGREGLRGRMVFGGNFFPALEVNGRRQRLGLEMALRVGPASLKGELVHGGDTRRGQGIDNEDLGAVSGRGWYLSGTWLAAGAKPGDGDRRRDPRFGGVELAARIEGLRFGGPVEGDEPSRSPRAVAVLPNAEGVWTCGVNWYVNQFVRLQGNAIRERLDEAARAPIPNQHVYWSGILRFQFVL